MDRGSGIYVSIGAEPSGSVQNIGNIDGGGADDFARHRRTLPVRYNNSATRPWIHFLATQLLVGINTVIRLARNTFGTSYRSGGRRNFRPIRSVRATGTARAI